MKRLVLILALSSPLFSATPTLEVTTMKEYNLLTAQDKPLVLFFYAPWCSACKSMKKPYDEVAQELKNNVIMVKISIDKLRPLAESLGVKYIPTIFTRKVGGSFKKTLVGEKPKHKLKKAIEAAIR